MTSPIPLARPAIAHVRPMSPDDAGHRLLRAPEAAALLTISLRTLWRLVAAQRLPAPLHVGRSARWRSGDLHWFVATGQLPPPSSAKQEPSRTRRTRPTTANQPVLLARPANVRH